MSEILKGSKKFAPPPAVHIKMWNQPCSGENRVMTYFQLQLGNLAAHAADVIITSAFWRIERRQVVNTKYLKVMSQRLKTFYVLHFILLSSERHAFRNVNGTETEMTWAACNEGMFSCLK